MKIRCTYYESADAARAAGGGEIQTGAIWPADAEAIASMTEHKLLSVYYEQHNAGRPPLYVKLPDGTWFCVDMRASDDKIRAGWTVTGVPPKLTVKPSIKVTTGGHGSDQPEKETFHGFLTNGYLHEGEDLTPAELAE